MCNKSYNDLETVLKKKKKKKKKKKTKKNQKKKKKQKKIKKNNKKKKKKKKKKGTANISGIAIKSQSTTSNFFNGGLGAIEGKPTIFKINN